jgi:prophage regulatory protein
MSAAPLARLLSQREVLALLGVSRVSVYKWRREGRFPAPVVLSTRTLRWREDDVAAFVAARQAAR